MQEEKFNGLWSRGLQQASDLLIRRGTAMGPLVPTLFLVPIFLFTAYIFREQEYVCAVFSIAAILVVAAYLYFFSLFARKDPDRLQSEEYRCEMTKIQMVAGKGLPHPVPANELHLPSAASNPEQPALSIEVIPNSSGNHTDGRVA